MNTSVVFGDIWTAVAVPILAAAAPMISALQGWVTGWFQVAVLAYLLGMLLIATWSDEEEVALRFFRSLFLAFMVFTIATTAGAFATYVSGLVNGLVNGISAAVAGVLGGTAANAQSFDTMATRLFGVGLLVFRDLPWYSPKGWILGLVVVLYWVASFVAISFMFVMFLLSSVILQFLIAFGPVFVACFFFPFTRQFFDGWLRVVVAALITQIFIIGLMTLFITTIGTLVTTLSASINAGSDGFIGSIFVLVVALVMCGIFAFSILYVSRLAQSIAGGAHAQLARSPIRLGRVFSAISGGHGGTAGTGGGRSSEGGGGSSPGNPSGSGSTQYAFQRNVGSAS